LDVRVTAHVPVPLQAPDHPANVEPVLEVAVSVTAVPLAKLAVHVVGQLMPEGVLMTVPVPVPASCTVSWTVGVVEALNVAVTEVLAVRFALQVPVPLHAPDHPANVEPEFGVAVSVTVVPLAKLALHVWPQLIPEGLLVVVPDPVPLFCTVSSKLEGTVEWTVDPQPQRMIKSARHERLSTRL
jgi:hypothetical protein